MDKEEIRNLAKELVELTLEVKDRNKKIKELKGKILEYTDLENLCAIDFEGTAGYWVAVDTKTSYKLVDIPAENYEVRVDSKVIPEDIFIKNVKTDFSLSRQGKKLLKKGDETIRKYLIPTTKKVLKVTNKR